VRHGQRGFGRHVARRRAGAAGGQHQAQPASTSSISVWLMRLLVGDQPCVERDGVVQRARQPVLQRGQALVFIDAAATHGR
jgi:hypothetical protein